MFVFLQWTFLHQNLTRNLKIIGLQSENNFPWKYDVISHEVIFPALCVGLRLKNKVLVHFCTFLYAIFNYIWIHQLHWMQKFWKVIYDVILGKCRILETFFDQVFHHVSSVSLNLI